MYIDHSLIKDLNIRVTINTYSTCIICYSFICSVLQWENWYSYMFILSYTQSTWDVLNCIMYFQAKFFWGGPCTLNQCNESSFINKLSPFLQCFNQFKVLNYSKHFFILMICPPKWPHPLAGGLPGWCGRCTLPSSRAWG